MHAVFVFVFVFVFFSEPKLCANRDVLRLKKKYLGLKACKNFSNRRGMRFFIFYFIFVYINWPLPPRTCETKND